MHNLSGSTMTVNFYTWLSLITVPDGDNAARIKCVCTARSQFEKQITLDKW